MKKTLGLFLILFSQLGLAQQPEVREVKEKKESLQDAMDTTPVPDMESPSPDESAVYDAAAVEVKAQFPGGMDKFDSYATKNFNVPAGTELKGKVVVNFIVEKDGSLTNLKVLRDLGHQTGKEAVRVLTHGPRWTPAFHNGKPVRSNHSVAISVQSKK